MMRQAFGKAGGMAGSRVALVLLLALWLLPGYVFAGPYTVKVSPSLQLQLGQKEQRFEQFLDQDLSFYMVRLGGGLAIERWFVNLALDWSLNQARVSEEEERGQARRREFDISLGYPLSRQFTLFSGYKFGQTKLRLRSREDAASAPTAAYQNRFEEAGPYLGLAWAQSLTQDAQLSLSLAYGWLQAENIINAPVEQSEPGDEPEFDDLRGRLKADSRGFGLGLNWSLRLNARLLYQAGLRWQRYQQRVGDAASRFNVQETFSEIGMGLRYSL